MSSYQLSQEQLAKFHKDGYLVVTAEEHKLVTGLQLKTWANEVYSWPREKGKWMPYDEVNEKGERQLMRTECFVDYHDGLNELLRGDKLAVIMRQLAGEVSPYSASTFVGELDIISFSLVRDNGEVKSRDTDGI